MNFYRRLVLVLIVLLGFKTTHLQVLNNEVRIQRTQYGVPHIMANNLYGAAFGLAFAQMEDYGEDVILPIVKSQGKAALKNGYSQVKDDFFYQQSHKITSSKYHLLDQNTRDLLEGFAAGIMHFLKTYPLKDPYYRECKFTGIDIAAVSTYITDPVRGEAILEIIRQRKAELDSLKSRTESGSNTWAFGPQKTKSGHPILMRNPHLSWSAGYYEAHLTVPGKLNFYGDFRIGGLFRIIGGFNDRLGWSTTNNHPEMDEFYALAVDSSRADHYILDGLSHVIEREWLSVNYKNGPGLATEKREFLYTQYGPVVARENGLIYILKRTGNGAFRRADQFTRMMMASNLDQWKEAMRIQAISQSNYTYADVDGNIFYVWNGMIPDLPIPSGGDTSAVFASSSKDMWSSIIPFDQLPILENPIGGYLHNENDPFHFTNLNQILAPENYPSWFIEPKLRQRSQHSLHLIHNSDKYSLEDVVKLKHSTKMFLADQLKEHLVNGVKSSNSSKEIKDAAAFLEQWDNSVDAKSKGGVLFQAWYKQYKILRKNKSLFDVPWTFKEPMNTPSGIADMEVAVIAFRLAVKEVEDLHGSYQVSWGDVHRIRLGEYDLPASGGPGALGCFRVLDFKESLDGKKEVYRGDGWQFAVEFSDPPKAYSILAYGQSNNPESPHHTDQIQMFSENKMKKVAFTQDQIQANLIREYKLKY